MERGAYTNSLINETSPYLLQHAHNPVNWYAWGKAPLEKAKKENKLLLISIGYSACHWCHVMEHESFEDEEIAAIMNEHFICIKVDREERPDIDQVYMNAVQLIAGNGGWPLNCFALPDGSPVYGGTYFKPQQWKNVLENIALSYKTEPGKFKEAAKELKNGIVKIDNIVKNEEEPDFSYEELLDIILKMRKRFDFNNGGLWGAPKFPMPVIYFPLMRYYYHSREKDISNHVFLTLDKMADGGIYDHIGGGFARYSVDREWLIPHFEKMLYDNAQLVSLYAEAYRINNKPAYKNVVTETLEFLERDMMSGEGAFYSSYDADSEGEEGKYYVWDKYEVDLLLKEKSELFCDYYNITEEGNWEGRNILNIKETKQELAQKYNVTVQQFEKIIRECKEILFEQRIKRVKPTLDDKVLVSWNALTITAFVDAYNVFHNKKYLEIAIRNFEFIKNKMLHSDYSLKRNYKNGKATIDAFLDDYALLINAATKLYQATFNEEYIYIALRMSKYTIQHFYDNDTGMFFYVPAYNSELIARTKELTDNVIPGSNSVMAKNLLTLGHIFVKGSYLSMVKQMLMNLKKNIQETPLFYGNWIDIFIQLIHTPYEVCLVGEKCLNIRSRFFNTYLPNIIIAGGNEGKIPLLKGRYTSGKTTIYVCKDNVCNKPVKSFDEALELLTN